MAALRTDIQVALELSPIEHRIARRTFDPKPLRYRACAALGLDARGHDLLEPGHWRRSLGQGCPQIIADCPLATSSSPVPGSAKAAGYLTAQRYRPSAGAVGAPRLRSRLSSNSVAQDAGKSPRPTAIRRPARLRII